MRVAGQLGRRLVGFSWFDSMHRRTPPLKFPDVRPRREKLIGDEALVFWWWVDPRAREQTAWPTVQYIAQRTSFMTRYYYVCVGEGGKRVDGTQSRVKADERWVVNVSEDPQAKSSDRQGDWGERGGGASKGGRLSQ